MVHRRSAADRIASGQVHDDDEGMLPQDYTVELPPEGCAAPPGKKRRREGREVPKKRLRREKGGLCQLNLDELYIIFAYIYPMDLLNLARTCKSLRDLLMHKSALFLWKTALRQIEGLPDCPADLDEPEYANLVFYTRCHGCGKSAKTVFWNMRRRYCPACRVERYGLGRVCDITIKTNTPLDRLSDSGQWVDRDQMDSFLCEYRCSSDKTQFLDEKRNQCQNIYLHARKCESWQQQKGRVHRFDLEILRKERQTSIFERLRQRGYGSEIAYFGDRAIEKAYKCVFKRYRPLTDSEWNRMWPEWVKIFKKLRSQRTEATLYLPRRCSLVPEYERYVMHPSPDTPTFDLLPHVVDLARFPPFRDIIRASEGTQLDDKPFASAFAQLPALVNEWVQKLSSETAGLMKIPSCLSSGNIARDQDMASSSAGHAELSQTDLEKLHLACAVFHVDGTGVFAHPEVLSVSMRNDTMFPSHEIHLSTSGAMLRRIRRVDESAPTGWIHDRFGLQFLEEAPYIVHACGLDPNVATVDDMNRRNARLKCLSCGGRTLIMNWRHAV
ncbi:hypothetical protein J3R82DRAFT_1400 [Butyriboletus roseoflavus]|nr:hypothetical protein J3R82DRAFT_1400 [Butyriboletus roseoflavus]